MILYFGIIFRTFAYIKRSYRTIIKDPFKNTDKTKDLIDDGKNK